MPDGSAPTSSIGPSKNPAFVLKGINDVVFEDRPMPDASKLGPLDVLVAPKATGICGSDVHYLRHGSIGDFVVKAPMILGHESSGLVAAVGANVKDLKVGDRVALEPGKMCRHCNVCKHGMYELCKDMEFAATPPYDGTLAGFYTLPSDLCYKLPENVSMEEGCMIEPLSVGVQSVAKLAKLRPNENIVILGAGPVGLLCMAVAKAFGARRIVAIDINNERLAFAKEYAATDIWTSTPKNQGESTMDYARRQAQEITSKMGFGHPTSTNAIDVVIDCTGAPVCIATGIFLVKSAGRYIQVGMGPDNVEIPLSTALTKMVNMQGSFRYGAGVYQLAIDLVAQGKINLKPLISHQYAFKDAKEAFQCMIDNKGHDGKPPIKCIIAGPEV